MNDFVTKNIPTLKRTMFLSDRNVAPELHETPPQQSSLYLCQLPTTQPVLKLGDHPSLGVKVLPYSLSYRTCRPNLAVRQNAPGWCVVTLWSVCDVLGSPSDQFGESKAIMLVCYWHARPISDCLSSLLKITVQQQLHDSPTMIIRINTCFKVMHNAKLSEYIQHIT